MRIKKGNIDNGTRYRKGGQDIAGPEFYIYRRNIAMLVEYEG
ncbi:MAG: hypothetical protein QXU98_07165 [Candidatus Parvarchaeota archaeon]